MAFPTSPLSVFVELNLNGTWTDVTAYTYLRNPIQITRGRRNEGASFEPSQCQLTLNNRDGRFSPRNPSGPYYGQLTRNTPLRVSALVGQPRLVCPAAGDRVSAPDTAGLSITGDIDLRADVRLNSWDHSPSYTFLSKSLTAGQKSYRLGSFNGDLFIGWSADGTNELFADSTVNLPATTGRQVVRATLDVDDGAGNRVATFYYGPTMSGPWTQLGPAITQAGTTSIFDGTGSLYVGAASSFTVGPAVYAAQVLQGIGGTVRANPDFTAQAEGASSFADAAGNTWTVEAGASITARRYRFYGEVSSWPQEWDISQRDVWVSVTASGILRRLAQGAAQQQGTLQRWTLTDANVRGYWPMEDGANSTRIASGLSGGKSMAIVGSPQLASSTAFITTNPLPVMAQAVFQGRVNSYTATGTIHVRWLMSVPSGGDTDGGILMRLYTTGTAARWDFSYATAGGGGLNLNAYDSSGANILTTGAGFQVNGKLLLGVLELVQSGGNINWQMLTIAVDGLSGLSFTGTLLGRTVGAATFAENNSNALLSSTAIGHMAVLSASPVGGQSQIRGYFGETAGRRVERLCSEAGIPFAGYGDLDDSVAMGSQAPGQILTLLAECDAADLGQLFESRDQLGLAYRTRSSRAIQGAGVALTYGALSELHPVEDDQRTRNDITVSRVRGSSARATVDTGALSTLDPPNGVGRYDSQVTLNLSADSQCVDQANLRVVIGTIDQPRYPVIRTQLEGPGFTASPALTTATLEADHGDLITVTGTPVWLPPETVRQHTIGSIETVGMFDYQIDFVCQPATPIGAAGTYDDGVSRWAGGSSTLTGSITSTATGAAALSITTPLGEPLWTSNVADFPMDITVGGEKITLSAIAATASPQAATVSARSVNGVVKAHTAGEALQIAGPVYYAL